MACYSHVFFSSLLLPSSLCPCLTHSPVTMDEINAKAWCVGFVVQSHRLMRLRIQNQLKISVWWYEIAAISSYRISISSSHALFDICFFFHLYYHIEAHRICFHASVVIVNMNIYIYFLLFTFTHHNLKARQQCLLVYFNALLIKSSHITVKHLVQFCNHILIKVL